jgi:DNA repair photolyase
MFVRWENLTVDEDERARLPGYREAAVVRRFRAPEALDTRFYEVRAKSILNRVPEASRMPFRWTVNPYRGCSHACSYCLGPETAILMADGRSKPIADLEVGEPIYGTVREGVYRRLTITRVINKWSSIKPAYAVDLDDGTQLITSADHRFLTRRGWKHVIGSEQGPMRRPHLTVGTKLMGTGGFVTPPVENDAYRHGYLCGMIRGDGYLRSTGYTRSNGSYGRSQRAFRLALTDHEALDRSRDYLAGLGVGTRQFLFQRANGNHRAMWAISASGIVRTDRIEEIIRWPILPTHGWIVGFLAGIFDAEGSCSRGIWRISNTDSEIIDWIRACLSRLGFVYALEHRQQMKPITTVRARGGLSEQVRFFLGTDPAITRKRSLEGKALKTDAPLRVRSIRPLGMVMRMYDITTGTGDFIANGVVSHNCFARPTHRYLDFDAGRDFEREIVVKVNAPELLRAELARPSWGGEHVALGTNTDPYQWVEGRYRLMPGIWEALRDAANPCSVLTKSPLLLRDLELMREIAARTSFSAALSVPTLDERAWRATEPHTPNPRARLEAVAALTRAGIETGVLIAPLMPGVNDAPEQVGRIVELATEAGASFVSGIALHLRGEVKELFFAWLRNHRPDLIDRYKDLYRTGAYAPVSERRRLGRLVSGPDREPSDRMRGSPATEGRSPPARRPTAPPVRMDPQQRLF